MSAVVAILRRAHVAREERRARAGSDRHDDLRRLRRPRRRVCHRRGDPLRRRQPHPAPALGQASRSSSSCSSSPSASACSAKVPRERGHQPLRIGLWATLITGAQVVLLRCWATSPTGRYPTRALSRRWQDLPPDPGPVCHKVTTGRHARASSSGTRHTASSARGRARERTPGRHPRHRSLACPRWTARRHDARRPGGARHQGGDTGHGDDTRGWGPPLVGPEDDPISTYYLSCNRNKESVASTSSPRTAATADPPRPPRGRPHRELPSRRPRPARLLRPSG